MDRKWCLVGVNNVLDIPLEEGQIAISAITEHVGPSPHNYLRCCTIQGTLLKFLSKSTAGNHLPNSTLISQMKTLLHQQSLTMLTLTRWEHDLHILPLNQRQSVAIFTQMLCNCKVTKLWDVNFKILSCILATPVVVVATRKQPKLQWCAWCGAKASIMHILFECQETQDLHNSVIRINIFRTSTLRRSDWIFELATQALNPVIWITNFVKYKAQLMALDGQMPVMYSLFERECY